MRLYKGFSMFVDVSIVAGASFNSRGKNRHASSAYLYMTKWNIPGRENTVKGDVCLAHLFASKT